MKRIDRTKLKVALAELMREKQVREFYYPKAISEGKLTRAEASRRLEALSYAIEILSDLLRQEEVTSNGTHSHFVR